MACFGTEATALDKQLAWTDLQSLNKAAYAALREALKSGSSNVDALKRIARETDDMVDAA